MNSKTLLLYLVFEIGKTLLVVYKIRLIFHIYSYTLHYPFLTSRRISNPYISNQIDPSYLASGNRVILAWMFLLTVTQLSFSLISVFSFIRFELRTQEATQLKMELDKAQETIQAAETLVSKLDGEFKRWSGQVLCIITIRVYNKFLSDRNVRCSANSCILPFIIWKVWNSGLIAVRFVQRA